MSCKVTDKIKEGRKVSVSQKRESVKATSSDNSLIPLVSR